jgi:hypothetical protein
VQRQVKGTLFVDYVRMLRGHKSASYAKYLIDEDKSFLVQRIAHGDLETVRAFGRMSIDWLCQQHPGLLASGDPRDTVMRFQVLRSSFFDYGALEISSVSDGEASLHVGYGMGDRAEEAASWQTLGFFERLLEVAGAKDVRAWFSKRTWVGDPGTVIQLRWTQAP